jgi:Ran GTPase-activating protein (RanGAP) involved in mRNA processing and transport
MKALDRLQSLGLTDNRLSSTSLPTIIGNLHYQTVQDLDLSFNFVHDQGAKALANHFRYTGNVLRYLDLCNCQLKSSDIKILCDILKVHTNNLEELYLAGNLINEDGSADLCIYLSSRSC